MKKMLVVIFSFITFSMAAHAEGGVGGSGNLHGCKEQGNALVGTISTILKGFKIEYKEGSSWLEVDTNENTVYIDCQKAESAGPEEVSEALFKILK